MNMFFSPGHLSGRSIIVLFAVVCATFTMCTRKESNIPVAQDTVGAAQQTIQGCTIRYYEKQQLKWRLNSSQILRTMGKNGDTRATPVYLRLYSEDGDSSSRIIADSGRTNAANTRFRVWGNVHVWTPDSLVIRAQSLTWNQKTHEITSDSYVEIKTSLGDVMRGKGLTANESFTRWEFHENVSGSFPRFERRMQQENLME